MTRSDIAWPRTSGDLSLVLPTAELIDDVLAWRNEPEVTRWLLSSTVDPVRFRRAWLDSVEDARDHAVVALLDGKVVGTGSLEVHDAPGQSHAEPARHAGAEGLLGYLVDPAYVGRGHATAIAGGLLALAFEELGLHRVTAACFTDNVASWKVMEKLSMRREQHSVRDAWHADLGWVDGFGYAILVDEWQQRSSPQ